ncbi:MAG: hypothetical protein QM638_05565 [Nocardioides sp.]|uniref:hypothetical protein n=1 Tax=Nocardioides sp. TaxID=35761 RepID=UPI0039E41EF4
MSNADQRSVRWPTRLTRLTRRAAPVLRPVRIGLVAVLLVAAPFAGALVAVQLAPAMHLEVVGQQVSLKPVIGRDTTVFDGAIVRAEHGRIPGTPITIGVDVGVDWNRLIPQDKQTRRSLAQLWNDPDPEMARLRDRVEHVVLGWGLIGFGGVLLLEAVAGLALLDRRRKLASYPSATALVVAAHNRRLRRWAAGGTVLALVAIVAGGARLATRSDHQQVVGSAELAGTRLAGTQVNGLVAEVLPFLSILQPASSFYDTAAQHLDRAIAAREANGGLDHEQDDVVFVAGEDFEDVNGMARLFGRTAHLVDADFLAFTGDLTFAGKAVESYLVDTIDYYSQQTPVVFAPGLHDTTTIVGAATARGWQVADGQAHDLGGLSVMAFADPRISTVGDFGTGTVRRDPDVDVDQFVTDATAKVCDSRPDVVLLHDHKLGARIAAAGCQQVAVIDGRSYDLIGPQRIATVADAPNRSSWEYTNGSGGGHTDTSPNPGTITDPATFTIFRYRPGTDIAHGDGLRYSVVSVKPDASVKVTPWIDLDVPYDDYVSHGTTH